MKFLIENWPIIVVAFAAVVVLIISIIKLFTTDKKVLLANLKEWLLYATTLAEKELGSGTGILKLRYVYDMFVVKFPWLAKIISFDYFSDLVDDTLDSMNNILINNNAVQLYVNGPDEGSNDSNAKG